MLSLAIAAASGPTAGVHECCEAPPVAVCTNCDAEEKICHACAVQNRSWREARQAYTASTPEEVVEVGLH